MDLVTQSPGLHALMTACTTPGMAAAPAPASAGGAASSSPRMAAITLTSPAAGARPRNAPNMPITDMSILQLASPHSTRQAASSASAQLSPQQLMPPPSPAQHVHTSAQSQLLAMVTSSAVPSPEAPAAVAHDDSAMSDDEDDDEEDEGEEDEEEYEDGAAERDGADSAGSQSCPPSPLASLAALSAADATAAVPGVSLSGRRTSRQIQQPLRRRSVGSSSQAYSGDGRRASASEASFKHRKPAATGSPAFKASKKGGEGSSAGGSSCHQCKSRRAYNDLTYCTSSLNKKRGNAVCRKKFCEHCLKKFYREAAHPPTVASSAIWKCPSCRKICCCAACRRREQRDEGDAPAASSHSHEGTPMPTPLYRGEAGSSRADHDMQSSPLQSSSPSPTALSMRRLMLSPTGHTSSVHSGSMSPLMAPASAGSASKHHVKSLSHFAPLNHTPPKSSAAASPADSPSSSPTPPDHHHMHAPAHMQHASQLASLTALSQAAMRDSPHHSSITISLNHATAPSSASGSSAALHHHHHQPAHLSSLQQHQAHQAHTTSSLASSAVSSPNDVRTAGSSAGAGGMGTPKATSTSLYSNLLLQQHGLMLTPRSMPRAALPAHLTAPAFSLGAAPKLSPGGSGSSAGSGGSSAANLSLGHAASFSMPSSLAQIHGGGVGLGTMAHAGTHGGIVHSNGPAGVDTSLSSNDNDSHSASSREDAPGAVVPLASSHAGAVQSRSGSSGVSAASNFALYYALGELPSVRRDVQAILAAKDGSSNRDRLARIEALFDAAAEKVASEELALQI